MASSSKRPWYRLHWLTWLVLIVLVLALVEREREVDVHAAGFSSTYFHQQAFGWPKKYLTVLEEGPMYPRPGELPTFTYHWNDSNLFFNLLFCFLLTAATAHAFELWLRSPNRLHISLGSLLGLIGVAAILTGIVNGNINASLDWLGLPNLYLVDWGDLRHPLKWPLILALGCTIYSSGWLATVAALRLAVLLRPPLR